MKKHTTKLRKLLKYYQNLWDYINDAKIQFDVVLDNICV